MISAGDRWAVLLCKWEALTHTSHGSTEASLLVTCVTQENEVVKTQSVGDAATASAQ